MYAGEVNVAQDQLPQFLKTAERLKAIILTLSLTISDRFWRGYSYYLKIKSKKKYVFAKEKFICDIWHACEEIN